MSSAQGAFLTAEWQYLAMLNYEVDPGLLEPFVPAGTELDSFEGRCFVSMVGFLFLNTRVLGVPLPLHRDFEEVNLRFYVRRGTGEEWRRGVVFIKEIVPRRAIAAVARVVYGENYVALPMGHEIAEAGAPEVSYSWRFDGRENRIRLAAVDPPLPVAPGSEEEFITEHYWGYSSRADGTTIEYQVEHPRWRVWKARDASLDCDVAGIYGKEFVEPLKQPPSSAFLADGSAVTVFRGRRLAS